MRARSLVVEFEKRADGECIMRCTRDDGSSVWQRHAGARAAFFAFHDLTHLAVECELGVSNGFFGLIAQGWEIADTEGRGSRGGVPADAVLIENLVGLFDRERAGGVHWSASEFNDAAAMYAVEHGHAIPPALDDDQVARIRDRVADLHAQWRGVAPGRRMRVAFTASSPGSSRDT